MVRIGSIAWAHPILNHTENCSKKWLAFLLVNLENMELARWAHSFSFHHWHCGSSGNSFKLLHLFFLYLFVSRSTLAMAKTKICTNHLWWEDFVERKLLLNLQLETNLLRIDNICIQISQQWHHHQNQCEIIIWNPFEAFAQKFYSINSIRPVHQVVHFNAWKTP